MDQEHIWNTDHRKENEPEPNSGAKRPGWFFRLGPVEFGARLSNFYQHLEGGCSHTLQNRRFVAGSKINDAIRDYFDEKYKAGEIHPVLWEEAYKRLNKGVSEGWGAIAYKDESISLINQLKTNTAVFSAFKNHAQSHELVALLVNEEGKRRSWPDFRKEAAKVDAKYNRQWLEAEYNHAQRAARSAELWNEFQRTKDLYPNIEYLPSSSADPRQVHEQYYGIIKPIDDPFWIAFFPPNGWGCKCGAGKSRGPVSTRQVDPPEPIDGLPGNAGFTQQVFTPTHPFVQVTTSAQRSSIQKQLNAMNQGLNDFAFIPVGKRRIKVHTKADPQDLIANKDFAVAVVQRYSKNMEIREHSYNKGVKNPEYVYDKTVGDRVAMQGDNARSFVSNAFDKKLNKGGQLRDLDECFLALDFSGNLNASNMVGVAAQLNGKLQANSSVKFVLLKNGSKLVRINNKQKTMEQLLETIRKELVN